LPPQDQVEFYLTKAGITESRADAHCGSVRAALEAVARILRSAPSMRTTENNAWPDRGMQCIPGSAMTGGAARRRALERPSTMETAVSCRKPQRHDPNATNSLLIVNPPV